MDMLDLHYGQPNENRGMRDMQDKETSYDYENKVINYCIYNSSIDDIGVLGFWGFGGIIGKT